MAANMEAEYQRREELVIAAVQKMKVPQSGMIYEALGYNRGSTALRATLDKLVERRVLRRFRHKNEKGYPATFYHLLPQPHPVQAAQHDRRG